MLISIFVQEEFEDIKEIITIRKSKKDRKNHDLKKKDKRTYNDLQNITQKTINRSPWLDLLLYNNGLT
jgi:hypothetical protein